MRSRLSSVPSYLIFLGVAMIVVVGLLPVTLPSQNDVFVPDSAQHYEVGPLTRDVAVGQQFTAATGTIDSVTLLFAVPKRTDPGILRMVMRVDRDGAWKALATQSINPATLRDKAYFTFTFSPPLRVSVGEQCQIVLQADDAVMEGVSLLATTEWQRPDGYVLTVSDAPQPGTMIFRVTYGRVSGHVVQMLGRIWQRSTVLLSVRWQLVLGAAIGVMLMGIVMLGRPLTSNRPRPHE